MTGTVSQTDSWPQTDVKRPKVDVNIKLLLHHIICNELSTFNVNFKDIYIPVSELNLAISEYQPINVC